MVRGTDLPGRNHRVDTWRAATRRRQRESRGELCQVDTFATACDCQIRRFRLTLDCGGDLLHESATHASSYLYVYIYILSIPQYNIMYILCILYNTYRSLIFWKPLAGCHKGLGLWSEWCSLWHLSGSMGPWSTMVDHRRPSVHGFVAQASPTGGINAVWVMPEDDWEMSCVAWTPKAMKTN